MNIKLELLKEYISSFVNNQLNSFEIDADEIADSTAICALAEIQKVIQDENCSDFDAVEQIVCILKNIN